MVKSRQMRLILLAALMSVPGLAQFTPPPSPITAVTVAPNGACLANAGQLVGPSGVIYTCQNGTWAVSGGGGGSAPAGSAGAVNVYGTSSAFAGDVLVSALGMTGSTVTGGAYISATADANGGGPKQCPIWFWGDATCAQPSALMLNSNFSGDLSSVSFEHSVIGVYGNFNHTGSASAELEGLFENVVLSGSGPLSYSAGHDVDVVNNSTGNIAFLYGQVATIDQLGNSNVTLEAAYAAVLDLLDGTLPNVYGYYLHMTNNGPSPATNLFSFWSDSLSGFAVNPYYSWFDSQGVRRVKEDASFNSVGQAIEALYNPQFTKYTPGAANYERLILGEFRDNVAEIGTYAGGTGTVRDQRLLAPTLHIGTASNISSTTFTGTGVNDGVFNGTYTGSTLTYCVIIQTAATPDTFEWGTNGGCNNGATGVAITGANQTLSSGAVIKFATTTGHTAADKWSATATAAADYASVSASQIQYNAMKTTGSATGKTVVCVDVTTGIFYASTSGVACAN